MGKTVVDVITLEEGESRTRQHSWADNLPASTFVNTHDISATDLLTGLDGTDDIIYTSSLASPLSTIVFSKIPGKSSTAYDVKLTMNRNDGEVYIDHYLVTADIDQTVYGLIDRALRFLATRNISSIISDDEQQQGLEVLNTMLLSWSAERNYVQAKLAESFTLSQGVNTYTIGPGGVFNTAYPKHIISAFTRLNGLDTQLGRGSIEGFDSIKLKSTLAPPTHFYFDQNFPLGNIYVYPTPDTAYSLSLRTLKEVGSYASVALNHGLEGDYEQAVSSNLALNLAPKYGIIPTQELQRIASASLYRLENLRMGDLTPSLDTGLLIV